MTKRLNKRLPTNFWQRLDTLPPWLVRLLAKKDGRDMPLCEQAMSDEEIALAMDVSIFTVRALSQLPNWHGVDVMVARNFMQACRCDPATNEIYRVRDYLFGRSRPAFKYLKFSPHWDATFKPLMKLYAGLK